LSLADRLHPLEPWEVSIVASATGTVPHLIETRELDNAQKPRALCGADAKRPTRIPFAARGCLRCCRVALQAGLRIVVVGPDDQLVDLREVRRNAPPSDERRA
jgi:hypothetical protein